MSSLDKYTQRSASVVSVVLIRPARSRGGIVPREPKLDRDFALIEEQHFARLW
jgi:hypothetical protein